MMLTGCWAGLVAIGWATTCGCQGGGGGIGMGWESGVNRCELLYLE